MTSSHAGLLPSPSGLDGDPTGVLRIRKSRVLLIVGSPFELVCRPGHAHVLDEVAEPDPADVFLAINR
jgi:hypothetical protein